MDFELFEGMIEGIVWYFVEEEEKDKDLLVELMKGIIDQVIMLYEFPLV